MLKYIYFLSQIKNYQKYFLSARLILNAVVLAPNIDKIKEIILIFWVIFLFVIEKKKKKLYKIMFLNFQLITHQTSAFYCTFYFQFVFKYQQVITS